MDPSLLQQATGLSPAVYWIVSKQFSRAISHPSHVAARYATKRRQMINQME